MQLDHVLYLNFFFSPDKHYNTFAEEEYRHGIFTDNNHIISKHNDLYFYRKTTFKMGINQYADMVNVSIIIISTSPYTDRLNFSLHLRNLFIVDIN